MVAKNDITGDSIATKFSAAYRDNWDAIFGKKEKKDEPVPAGNGSNQSEVSNNPEDDKSSSS